MAGSYNLGTAEGLIRIRYDGSGNDQAQQGFRQTEQSARRSGETFDRAGRQMAVAGGIVAAGIAFATDKAMDFEKEISAIAAVSGATKPELEAIRQKALQLGADTSFSATQAALAMEELAKAGISTKDILSGAADATVALAAAGGVELPAAATIAANAMNAFGLAAADLPKVADLIAGAANASAIDVGEFGQSLQQAGAVAHLAGVPFSDLSVAIAEMGNAGIKGSDAGTSLKTLLQNLIPQTKQQATLMSELGLVTKDGANQFFDASGKVKSLADVSQHLQNSLKGMGEEQKLATLQTLFGSDAIRAAAVLADNGAGGFTKLADSMGKVSAQDVAAERLNNTAGQMEQLKGSAETAAISFGTLLLPRINDLAKSLTDLANWLNGLSPGWKSFIVDATGATAGMLLAGAAIAKVVQMAMTISAAVKAIKAWEVGTKLASAATKAWSKVQTAFNLVMAMNPIVLVVIAIIALIAIIAILWFKSSAFRDFFIGIWNSIWGFLKGIGAWFAGPFANFFVQVWNVIKVAFQAWWAVVSGIFNVYKAVVMAVFGAVKAVVMGVINFLVAGFQFWWGIVSGILGFFSPIFKAVFGLIVAIVQTAWSIITALFQVAATIWGAIFQAIGAVISAVWNAIWSVISTVAGAIWSFILAVGGFILAYWQALWNGFLAIINAVWGFIGPYIMGAVQAIWNFLTGAWNAIVSNVKYYWDLFSLIISVAWQMIWGIISRIAGQIWDFITGVWNGIKSATSSVWNGVSSVIKSVWDFIIGIIRGAVQTVSNIINGISAIVGKVGQFFGELKNAASGGVGSLISFVSGIPGRILGALGDVGSMLFDSGKKIIQSLIDGISNMAGKVKDAIGDVLGKARNLLPFSPAKEGPFSGKGWTLYSGRSMVEALAKGIINSGDAVQRAIASVLGDTSTTLGLAVAASGVPVSPSSDLGLFGSGNSLTSIGGASAVYNVNTTVNSPAPIVDPEDLGRYTARRVVTGIATATSSSNLGGGS